MKKTILALLLLSVSLFAFEELNINNFDSKLKGKNVIVDFYATWCPPCHVLAKNLEDFDTMKRDDIYIYKVNIDEQMQLTEKFGIVSLPTLVFFKDGKVLNKSVGILSAEELQEDSKNIFK